MTTTTPSVRNCPHCDGNGCTDADGYPTACPPMRWTCSACFSHPEDEVFDVPAGDEHPCQHPLHNS